MQADLELGVFSLKFSPGVEAIGSDRAIHQQAAAVQPLLAGEFENGLVGGRAQSEIIGMAQWSDDDIPAMLAEACGPRPDQGIQCGGSEHENGDTHRLTQGFWQGKG